jgi:ATP-dependent RNA helicase DeaD
MTTPFAALGLGPALVNALAALGYEEPTPIQRAAIPALLAGRDLLGQAATGTGKTAAFALPLLERLPAGEALASRPRLLVLVPTRELAMQVAEAFHKYGRELGAGVVPIYGGQEFDRQIRALRRGVHVVVATPGRALDHLRRGTILLEQLQAVVLDEADEMLDMGFADELEAILDMAPPERQTALFSATMPPRIAAIAEKHLRDPERVKIVPEPTAAGALPRVRQVAYLLPRAYKVAALGRVLDVEAPTLAIIFCRTRTEVDQLGESLSARGFRTEALHGGMTQEQRDRVMKRVRAGSVDLLVATDVAARGLDIDTLTHVVNFDLPASPASYVHRIGRTGRAGREGVAITFAEPREHRMLRTIEQLTKQKIEVATLPTVLDVRARRLELVKAELREMILGGGTESARAVVESLADEFDLMQVALGAVTLAERAVAGEDADDEELPPEAFAPPRRREDASGRGMSFGDRGRRADRPGRGEPGDDGRPSRRRSRAGDGGSDAVRIYIGAGRDKSIRPTDLVGAIANEARIDARSIGAIEITEKFSLVEIPAAFADTVIQALRATTIKGKKLTVRRDMAGRSKPPRQ